MKPRRGKSGGSVVAAGAGGVVTSPPQMSPHVTRSLRVRTTHRPPHVRVGVSPLASSIVCSQSDHTEPPLSLIAARRTKIARSFRSAASPPHPLTPTPAEPCFLVATPLSGLLDFVKHRVDFVSKPPNCVHTKRFEGREKKRISDSFR